MSISNIPTFSEVGLSDDIQLTIRSYTSLNHEKWDQELKADQKISKFIRHEDSGLPFSIEYWGDNHCLVYTKTVHAQGNNKKVLYSADLEKGVLYARAKPLWGAENSVLKGSILKEEADKVSSFSGCVGVVQNVCSSHYLNKAQNAMKFHVIQELYEGTFADLMKRSLSDEELKIVVLSLMSGYASLHAKGLVHHDVKYANILFQITNGKVTMCVLCDLGEVRNSDGLRSDQTLDLAQREETREIVGMFNALYRSQQRSLPPIFKELRGNINPVTEEISNIASSSEALVALTNYYN